ncbi:hypothetical protein ANCCEY_11927 [Ancylostoma ceylanicum]|uniref:G-patch domain-containing protein n=1 Tax=Ancylostoma ceylanicum TaxID=53326 RepID=A0A0D6LMX2_9BILA|nr:hypothetical protein ANCCEY_11927 [Ancylostoma ceylanicum]
MNKKRKLTHLEDGGAQDDGDKKTKTAVIPVVKEHDWRIVRLLDLKREGKLTDEDRAKLAVLTGEQQFTPLDGSSHDNHAIIVDEERKETEDADYAAVPIEEFGLAILRGCGWKDGEGIGRNPQNGRTVDEAEEVIKKESLIRVTTGRYKGQYGKVESRDDDNNSLFVRLAVDKDDYDRERDKIEKRNSDALRDKDSRRYRNDQRDREDRAKDKYRPLAGKHTRSTKDEELWVRADLLVRFIDEDYKKGKYFKEKMRVVDVASRKNISLEDSHGGMHYGIRQSWLETVLPHVEKSRVMVVRGKYKGNAATMEKKDKSRCRVVARLLGSNEIITVDFDDVCQHQPKDDEDDY